MDFTSLWVTWQKYRNHVGVIVLTLIVFAVGWQTGNSMSPYYNATPILFIGSHDTREAVSAQLETLKVAGQAGPKVAAAVSSTTPAPAETASADTQYVASKNSTLYHHISCPSASRILPANKLTFKTAQEAEVAGFTPSKCTLDLVKK